MPKIELRRAPQVGAWGLRFAAAVTIGFLAGCASGSFTSPGAPPSTGGSTPPPTNSPSLPPLTPATAVNTYVGTQVPGPASAAPENIVSHSINQSNGTYWYADIPIQGAMSSPVGNSSGLIVPWYDFWDLGDDTGVSGLPGLQHYGLTLEETSRFAFFESNSSTQVAVLVPKQTSSCITPTAAATYYFVTLYGATFNPATDAAYGTFQLSASGASFTFAGIRQFTDSVDAATTGTIPFSAGSCVTSVANPEFGYFIDTPASSATGGTEMQSFLGPTGLLVANLQGSDSLGNPLPLPGVLAMIQPSSPIDLTQVTAPANFYNAVQYQPQGSVAVQYGFFNGPNAEEKSYISGGSDLRTLLGPSALDGGFQNPQMPLSSPAVYSTAFLFGPQDVNNPGLFPHAEFVYEVTSPPTCPAGTKVYPGAPTGGGANYIYCSSSAVAMVSRQNGKNLVVVTGISVVNNNSPTALILVQN